MASQKGSGQASRGEARDLPKLLQKTDLFCGFTTRELREMSKVLEMKKYSGGTEIFREGFPGTEMYLIIAGKVSITKGSLNVVLLTGDYFGEMALLDDRPRSATATMAEDGHLVSISKEQFRKLITSFPQFSINIMSTLCERLRKANELLWQLFQQLSRD